MRLFIAINFNTTTLSRLVELQDELRAESTKGRFSTRENLHLTLAFLGECDEKQMSDAKSAMEAVEFKPFELTIGSVGRFKRYGGDLWWAGVNDCKQLTALHSTLAKNLRDVGFQLETRPFSPHITLGREVFTNASPRRIEPFGQTVEKIELMKSERIAGKLVYSVV